MIAVSALRASTRFAAPRLALRAARAPAAALWARSYSSNSITVGSAVTAYASTAPTVKYTEEHEWIAVHEDGLAFIGITKYAADALGDATFIELPNAGDSVEKGDSIGSVESVKSASEIYTPVTCEIVEGNKELEENASIINSDPQGQGWFAKVQVTAREEIDELMNLEAYEEFIKEGGH